MPKTLILKTKTRLEFQPTPPFNFDATIFKPSHYPDPLKVYELGKYWFAMRYGNEIYGIKMENKGTVESPKVKVTIFSESRLAKNEVEKIKEELNFRFEFNKDISGFYKKFKNDKILSPFIKRWHGMHGSCAQSLYGLLMIGVFLQNTVVKRSVQMTKDLLEKYGIKVSFDGKEVYEFWEPCDLAKVPEEDLRKLKVGYRAKLFIKLSKTFVEEKIDEFELRKLSAEGVKKKLLKLYGVGPETARILLIEALHHYEIFEHVAPWQQKILSGLLFSKELVLSEKIVKYVRNCWGEWSALATHYIWEDIFWRRKRGEKIDWLEKEIRL
jgi:DNA-3-methyladenine glycosylase II